MHAVIQPRGNIAAAKCLLEHRFAAVEIKARHAEQVAEHTQHFPRRACLRQRLHHTPEALYPALGADERSRGFGKRPDRQQRVRIVECLVLVGRQGNHELRLLHCGQCLHRVVAIKLGLDAEQNVRSPRLPHHLLRVETVLRQRVGNIATHTVGGLTEEAKLCPDQICQYLRKCVQLACSGMLLGKIAEENAGVLAGSQAIGDPCRRIIGLDARQRCLRINRKHSAFCLCHRLHHSRERMGKLARRNDRLAGNAHQQIVIDRID